MRLGCFEALSERRHGALGERKGSQEATCRSGWCAQAHTAHTNRNPWLPGACHRVLVR